MPVLQNRLLLNRFGGNPATALHADVLYPSRRIWKLRLGQCNAAKAGRKRSGRIAGGRSARRAIPQTYFRYLKNGDFEPIRRIMAHNRQDIVSLAQLFFFLCRLHDKPETAPRSRRICFRSRALHRRGDTRKAKKCYRLSARDGAA